VSTYKFVFRIRRCYFDLIVAGKKTVEYRSDSEHWRKFIGYYVKRLRKNFQALFLEELLLDFAGAPLFFNPVDPSNCDVEAVFVCGKLKHTRKVVAIERMFTPYYFSDQGKKDVNTSRCLAFHLGQEVS
jgi:hypothetical protein